MVHEVSHVVLEHPPAASISGDGGCRYWNSRLEDEADWQAAALLVPRDGAFSLAETGRGLKDRADHFGVSLALFRWRVTQDGRGLPTGCPRCTTELKPRSVKLMRSSYLLTANQPPGGRLLSLHRRFVDVGAFLSLIFPLKKTNEDVRIENMNLWIIDEKLAYHYFVASDKPLKWGAGGTHHTTNG